MFYRSIVALIAFLIGVYGTLLLYDTYVIDPLQGTIKDLTLEVAYLQDTCPESLICYEPYGSAVEAEHVMDGSLVTVEFVDADDPKLEGVEAWAEWVISVEHNVSACHITAQFPTHVLGDPIMDSLGHEFLHCIVGSFHP